jgi:hypothetical protein
LQGALYHKSMTVEVFLQSGAFQHGGDFPGGTHLRLAKGEENAKNARLQINQVRPTLKLKRAPAI